MSVFDQSYYRFVDLFCEVFVGNGGLSVLHRVLERMIEKKEIRRLDINEKSNDLTSYLMTKNCLLLLFTLFMSISSHGIIHSLKSLSRNLL